MKQPFVLITAAMFSFGFCDVAASLPLLSEIRIDQPSTDNDEYFELRGMPGESLDGFSYLVIGDGVEASGQIEAVVDLTGLMIPSDGIFLMAENLFENGPGETFEGIIPDHQIPSNGLNFENSDNVTHLIVEGLTGIKGDDVDDDDDGALNAILPWNNVVDAVGFLEEVNPPAGTEFAYGAVLGFVDIGPSSSFVLGHLYRDESDVWQIGAFNVNDTDTRDDTPGTARNVCDFDGNGVCEIADINVMYPAGANNLVVGEPVASGNQFDLDSDMDIDNDDLDTWLSAAATVNGYSSPFRRGDTDDVGPGTVRDVDITDFNTLVNNFDPTGTNGGWDQANFDGDGDTDITDFNFLVANFSPTGYGPTGQEVPEPTAFVLILVAVACWLGRFVRRIRS